VVNTGKVVTVTFRENIFHQDNNILTFLKVCLVLIEQDEEMINLTI
tara:strand:- start:30256 stop:30393 length:138 start_codon:yes stop_codon:yes gene_type:complete